LDDAIRDSAQDAAVLDDYSSAVDEYRKAMKLNDAWEATKAIGKDMLTATIQNAPWIGATYAIAKKYMP
jgi:hypothetical protein